MCDVFVIIKHASLQEAIAPSPVSLLHVTEVPSPSSGVKRKASEDDLGGGKRTKTNEIEIINEIITNTVDSDEHIVQAVDLTEEDQEKEDLIIAAQPKTNRQIKRLPDSVIELGSDLDSSILPQTK